MHHISAEMGTWMILRFASPLGVVSCSGAALRKLVPASCACSLPRLTAELVLGLALALLAAVTLLLCYCNIRYRFRVMNLEVGIETRALFVCIGYWYFSSSCKMYLVDI